jgi:hypothetical protein
MDKVTKKPKSSKMSNNIIKYVLVGDKWYNAKKTKQRWKVESDLSNLVQDSPVLKDEVKLNIYI